jgi:hypothetical protein
MPTRKGENIEPLFEASAAIATTPGMFGLQGHWWYRGMVGRGFRWSVARRQSGVEHRSHRWSVPPVNKMSIGYRSWLQTGIGAPAATDQSTSAGW